MSAQQPSQHLVPLVPWPTAVPQRPQFLYGSAPDRSGQWWITIGCRRCGDVARKPCENPSKTGYWVVVYITQHACQR